MIVMVGNAPVWVCDVCGDFVPPVGTRVVYGVASGKTHYPAVPVLQ